MRPSSSVLRTLLKASGLVVPCLLCLTVAPVARADQSPVSRSQRRRQMVCDPRTAPLRKVIAAKASQGPVAIRSNRMQGGLTDTTARLLRASRTKLDEGAEAIQNDAPAAQIDLDEGTTSPLRPLGVLSSSFDRLPPAAPFSTRPPRGPPVQA
jgi:hypothetical protein